MGVKPEIFIWVTEKFLRPPKVLPFRPYPDFCLGTSFGIFRQECDIKSYRLACQAHGGLSWFSLLCYVPGSDLFTFPPFFFCIPFANFCHWQSIWNACFLCFLLLCSPNVQWSAKKKRGKIRLTIFPNSSFFRTVVITKLLMFHSADCDSDGRVLFQQELVMGEKKRSQVVGSLGVC